MIVTGLQREQIRNGSVYITIIEDMVRVGLITQADADKMRFNRVDPVPVKKEEKKDKEDK